MTIDLPSFVKRASARNPTGRPLQFDHALSIERPWPEHGRRGPVCRIAAAGVEFNDRPTTAAVGGYGGFKVTRLKRFGFYVDAGTIGVSVVPKITTAKPVLRIAQPARGGE